MGNLVYAPAANANGNNYATIGFKVQDSGGTANSGADTSVTANTLTINVTAANDAPTLTSITTLTGFTEDTYKEISYQDLVNAADESDVDAGDTIKFRIETVSTGTLQKWSGSAWADVTAGTTTVASGEKLQWKAAGNANGNGLSAFTVKAVDTAGDASGTAVQVKADVSAVNDVPVRTAGSTAAISVNEDSANATAVSLGLSSYTYSAGGGSDENTQTLTYTITSIPASITLWKAGGTEVNNNTTLTLDELQNLHYKTIANANNAAAANITWTVTDSETGSNSITETLSVTVTPVNDLPVVAGTLSTKTFTEMAGTDTGANAQVINSTVTVADADGTSEIVSAAVTITNVQAGDVLLFTNTAKITGVYSSGTLTLSKVSGQTPTNAEFEAALRSVKFNNTSDTPNTTARSITFKATDASATSTTFLTETVNVTATNDVPAPYLKSVAMTDTVITLTFDQAMDVSNYPELNSLSLKINSNAAGLSNVRQGANSSEISLTYTNPLGGAYPWTTNRNALYMDLNYNDANTGDAKALKSAAGGVAMDPFELTILWTNNNQSNSPPSIEGNTYIMGSGGDDFIIGGIGNDYLWGGDTLGAPKGNNTFKWLFGDAGPSGAVDTIKDFTRWNGSSGDKLSIYQLLSGFTLGSSTLSDWVKTVATGQTVNGVANSTVMTIDIDGSASGTVTQVIQFEGVNLLSGVNGANLTDQLRTLQSNGVFIA